MSMTAREIQAAYDKHRLSHKLADNRMALLLMDQSVEFFAEYPDWLEKQCTASSICQLQSLLLLYCEKNQSYLAMIFASSRELQDHFRTIAKDSLFEAQIICLRAGSRVGDLLHGEVIQRLDQKVSQYRELTPEAEQAFFVCQQANPWIIRRLKQCTLTFRQVIERAPHLLMMPWSIGPCAEAAGG